ncbi:MAG: glycosyltransferase family 2 protein [Methanosarcinales archaeon]|nr:glycosyltransferase family 2 protein [Methanosarcinales archaeon]
MTFTPVAFIIFNRPDTTKQVFAEIAKAKPLKLLIIADGPRTNHPEDIEKCAAARAIIDSVDWDCEVLTNYSDINLGCKDRVSSGLDWVFDTVEEAIILEDDCVPHPTFFRFCEELLEKYRDDKRIAMISGNNFQFGRKRTEYSYYFSRYPHIWGWASWRRAWKNYDVDMKQWPKIRDSGLLKDLLETKKSVWYWKNRFENVYKKNIDSWAYSWTFSCWIQNALTIIPKVNLVSNIGVGSEATHTTVQFEFTNIKNNNMNFPISHPPYIIRDSKADFFVENKIFSGSVISRIIKRAIDKLK